MRITVLAHLENSRSSKGNRLSGGVQMLDLGDQGSRELGLSRGALGSLIDDRVAYPEARVPALLKHLL